MAPERASGILLHPTSLPSRGGIGDFGPAAYGFADFLAAGKQTLWQVLPLGPVGLGNSPYSSISAFAGNPLLVSLERLAERGWIDRGRLDMLPDAVHSVDYESVLSTKVPLLREAARNFLERASHYDREQYQRFCSENGWWLEDYVLFAYLRQKHQGASWNRWPGEQARRDAGALERLRREAAQELDIYRVVQFAFFEQWHALRHYCAERAIQIIGDVAIFVSFDSADVWTHPDIFRLNHELEPEVVAGVPPDLFSETGQRWGNPLYRWDVLQSRGYDWWVQRMRWAVETCDIVRLDHFRGFEAYWEIPASEPTAVHGRWVKGPNDELFEVLRRELGGLPFIAEDLGLITPEVHALRERLQVPGMKVMQFGFSDRGARMYLPHRFEPNAVVYTGTHDNDTTLGWWKTQATETERHNAMAYLGPQDGSVVWALIRAAATSVARWCVVPLQDVLELDSEARMNTPSRNDGNWAWRFQPQMLSGELASRMAALAEVSDRDLAASAADQQRHGKVREHFAA